MFPRIDRPCDVVISEVTIHTSRATGRPYLKVDVVDATSQYQASIYGTGHGAVGRILLLLGIVDREIYGEEGQRPNIASEMIGKRFRVMFGVVKTPDNAIRIEVAEVFALAPEPVVVAWEHEPDMAIYEFYGLPCIAIRHPHLKHWCGYVGLPEGHRYHNTDPFEINVDVHGGWTWSKEELPVDEQTKEHYWWIGFDCNHAWDLAPNIAVLEQEIGIPNVEGREYRNLEFVKNELKRAAQQLCETGANEDGIIDSAK